MIYILYFSLLITNIACVLVRRNSRVIEAITVICTIVLMGGNDFNLDYIGYKAVYDGVYDPHFDHEYGLKLLYFIGNLFRIPYQGMCFIILGTALCVLLWLAQKENADLHLILALYLIFGFIADTIVIRNFIAIVFLTCALICLSRKKRVIGLLFLLASLLFHKTMLFYFPLLLIRCDNPKIRKIAAWGGASVVAVCMVVFAFGGRFEKIANFVVNIIYGGEDNIYFVGGVRYGFLVYFFVHLVTVFTMFYARKALLANAPQENSRAAALLDTAYVANCYVILCFPLLMISVAMHRWFRNIMFFNLICLGVTLNSFEPQKISSKYYRFCLILLAFAAAWRILYFFEIPVAFRQILENNILF